MDRPERTHTVRAFADRAAAERALDDLRAGGWPEEDLGFAVREDEAPDGMEERAERTAEGATAGALTGGLIGGLGVAAVSLLIPGVGPIIGGGLLAATLGGAALGAGAGGLLGALNGLGLPDDEARFYDEQLRAGRPLVSARAPGRHEEADAIMRRHGGYDARRVPAEIERS